MARTDLRGLSADNRATSKGRPGEDIDKKRKDQSKRKWDSKTIAAALARTYETPAHAKKGVARGDG